MILKPLFQPFKCSHTAHLQVCPQMPGQFFPQVFASCPFSQLQEGQVVPGWGPSSSPFPTALWYTQSAQGKAFSFGLNAQQGLVGAGCSVLGHTEGPGVGTFPLARLEVWARRIPEGRRSFHLVAANLVCAVCLLKLFAALRMGFLLPATSTGLNLPWLFGGRKKGA